MVVSNIFYVHPYLGGLEDSRQGPENFLPQSIHLDVRSCLCAIPSSPGWHRRARLKRSSARRLVRAYIHKPTWDRWKRIPTALHLLEGHHSRPIYWSIRQMGWPNQARYWKGSWQSGGNGKGGGGKPGKGKAPTSQKKTKEMDKHKDGEKDLIPDYDKIPGGHVEPSSSSAPSTSTDNLRKVVKAIAESNTVSLPEEALKLLQDDPEEELKQELKKTQQFLNRKRKLHSRIVRLKESLATKHKQFVSFKELMK